MKTYLVGGAVRDMLLGLESKDRDYVVVGSNEEEMLALGYSKVGASFPVFLHPETGDQYALARTEHKTGTGYNGFKCYTDNVSLEADLSRRDLTINSMAYDEDTKQFIDPFDGSDDLLNGIIRHTSDAFSEDPLRVLRVARFAARFGFTVHPSTVALCKQIVNSSELDTLSYNRIWMELDKIFDEDSPSIAIKFLMDIDIWKTEKISSYVGYPISIQWESKLSKVQKMYYYLSIGVMTLEDAQTFKVPLYVWKEIKFYQALIDFIVENDFTADLVVDFTKRHKQSFDYRLDFEFISMMKTVASGAFKSGDLTDISINKAITGTELLTKCYEAILSITYPLSLDSLPTESIKVVVHKMRTDAVSAVISAAHS